MEQSTEITYCDVHISLPNNRNHRNSERVLTRVKKTVDNIRNCDIFVDDYNIYIYADVELLKFEVEKGKKINIDEIKSLLIKYKTAECAFDFQLPCMPKPTPNEEILEATSKTETAAKTTKTTTTTTTTTTTANKTNPNEKPQLCLSHIKRITERCQLIIDDSNEFLQFEADFSYGFNSNYKGELLHKGASDISSITRITKPQTVSPLQRSIFRETDERNNFSQDQYKCDFIKLEIPEGHENPVEYIFYYDDITWQPDERSIMHNILTRFDATQFENIDTSEIDCGLLNLLMAICYDIRSTGNETNCESVWTRSTLSSVLCYFEPFISIRACVLSFLRRCLTYPFYRNYDFARLCIKDTINALQSALGCQWILHELIVTHQLFSTSENSREMLNHYYIEDYVRYVHNCSTEHLQMLARNLKNIMFDIFKTNLGLDLVAIETEVVRELISDIHANDLPHADDDDDGDGDGENDGEEESEFDDDESVDDDEDLTSTDTEENSVIEQRIEALKL